jgi:hypothetical protein
MITVRNPSKDKPTEPQGKRKREGKGNKGRRKDGRWPLNEYFQQATLCHNTVHNYNEYMIFLYYMC